MILTHLGRTQSNTATCPVTSWLRQDDHVIDPLLRYTHALSLFPRSTPKSYSRLSTGGIILVAVCVTRKHCVEYVFVSDKTKPNQETRSNL
ncbi:hypothetical protein VNO80_07511 [Phaseolus coccineus]|uniref:Uncharacterized protein n=1 Tax=Phaseolus coccineus TaxID=3886 RepID=A0AAN9NJ34_PHACN